MTDKRAGKRTKPRKKAESSSINLWPSKRVQIDIYPGKLGKLMHKSSRS